MKRGLALLVVLLVAGLAIAPVLAHEGREVGEYVIEFGWRVEPAYAGVYNGPEFWVENHDTETPVEGLEESLRLLVHFGDQEKALAVYPVWNDPGHYTADLIPTRPGDYSFHLFGTIEDQDVDEVFTSADGEFSSIEPAGDILFPDSDGDIASLQAQIDELRLQIEALQSP
jgi:hypothetical protein